MKPPQTGLAIIALTAVGLAIALTAVGLAIALPAVVYPTIISIIPRMFCLPKMNILAGTCKYNNSAEISYSQEVLAGLIC